MIQLTINEDVVLTTVGKAFSLYVVSQNVCSGEVFHERFPLITTRPTDCCDYLLDSRVFFNVFLFLLDGRDHKVLDEHSDWNFSSS